MSSYFDEASLVMIPSGYKTSKLYSVKPTDGSGDMAFTRSNDTATRVGPDGLIEKVRTNLALYSEQFDNAYWLKIDTTITDNATIAPDGSLTADKLVETAALGGHGVARVGGMTAAGVYALSVFAKAGERTRIAIGNLSAAHYAIFDLSLGTVVQASQGTVTNGTISSIDANGFYRVSCTITVASAASAGFNLVSTGTTISYTGDGTSGLFIWGAQLETGDIATDYIATTTAAVSVGPVANVPRLDYLNSSCPRLLLEPQRTNKITYSENQGPTGTNWYPSTTWTVTNNTVTSPSGYQDADTLTETTSNGFHSGYFNATIESSYTGTYTISAFAKYNGRIFVLNPYPTGVGRTYFDLQNGTVLQAGTGVTAKIENYGNGWYRCICTASFSSQNVSFEHMLALSTSTLVYTGDGTSGVHIWGCMAEAGAYATSYIPTLGAAVTRGADAASKTGISSLIGQTEGTLFIEYTANHEGGAGERIYAIGDGTANNRIVLFEGSKRIRVYAAAGGTAQWDFLTTIDFIGTHKVAVAYAANNAAIYVDGTQVGTDSSFVVPSVGNVYLGTPEAFGVSIGGAIKQALLFKTRLSNADLAALTA